MSRVVRIASGVGEEEEILIARGELLLAKAGAKTGAEAFRYWTAGGFTSKRICVEFLPRAKGAKRQISAEASLELLTELRTSLFERQTLDSGIESLLLLSQPGFERGFALEATWSFLRSMVRVEKQYEEHGRALDELFDSPQELVERSLQVVPDPSPWNETLGAFYDTTGVRQVLGDISRQAVMDRVKRRTLLGLKTSDGRWVYPVVQFARRNEVVEGLADVLQSFDPGQVDDWTVAGWLASDTPSLDGLSPLVWLREGRDPATVLALARDAARRLAA